MAERPQLWTRSFVCICIANFMLFFAFYLLLPIIPLYLISEFHTSKSVVGMVLSCYTVAALMVRPYSGYILDKFKRKPIYLGAYLAFVFIFIGYAEAAFLSMFITLRILHGLAYGLVSTAGNTIVVDIMPSERRGEGLGYFGVANNIAMAIGPMTSLFLVSHYSYNTIFYFSVGCGLLGFIIASTIKTPQKIRPKQLPEEQPLHSYDRFLLVKGIPAGLCLLLLAVPYGIMSSFIAIYGQELGITSGLGAFFSCMAVGLISSRLFAGKQVDRGKLLKVIAVGNLITLLAFFWLSSLKIIAEYSTQLSTISYFSIAIALGVGYGCLFPAYNTLFVNLAPHNRRATASSTYLTSWDLGIGVGLLVGGTLADTQGGLALSFFTGACAATIAIILFKQWAAPHFERNKLR